MTSPVDGGPRPEWMGDLNPGSDGNVVGGAKEASVIIKDGLVPSELGTTAGTPADALLFQKASNIIDKFVNRDFGAMTPSEKRQFLAALVYINNCVAADGPAKDGSEVAKLGASINSVSGEVELLGVPGFSLNDLQGKKLTNELIFSLLEGKPNLSLPNTGSSGAPEIARHVQENPFLSPGGLASMRLNILDTEVINKDAALKFGLMDAELTSVFADMKKEIASLTKEKYNKEAEKAMWEAIGAGISIGISTMGFGASMVGGAKALKSGVKTAGSSSVSSAPQGSHASFGSKSGPTGASSGPNAANNTGTAGTHGQFGTGGGGRTLTPGSRLSGGATPGASAAAPTNAAAAPANTGAANSAAGQKAAATQAANKADVNASDAKSAADAAAGDAPKSKFNAFVEGSTAFNHGPGMFVTQWAQTGDIVSKVAASFIDREIGQIEQSRIRMEAAADLIMKAKNNLSEESKSALDFSDSLRQFAKSVSEQWANMFSSLTAH